jgi:hypothetical protein
LPKDVFTKISVIKPPSNEVYVDFPTWSASADSDFSLESDYSLLMDKNLIERNDFHLNKVVWIWNGPDRIRSYWKIAHGRFMTNEERYKINMTDDNKVSLSLCMSMIFVYHISCYHALSSLHMQENLLQQAIFPSAKYLYRASHHPSNPCPSIATWHGQHTVFCMEGKWYLVFCKENKGHLVFCMEGKWPVSSCM